MTPETKEEARRLAELWASRSHPSQAEFGEAYKIGNQSAVGQFLRGVTPLSLKAALGFAQGLGCRVEDFSPRLAAEAAEIATSASPLSPEVAAIAAKVDALEPKARDYILRMIQHFLELQEPTAGADVGQPRRKQA